MSGKPKKGYDKSVYRSFAMVMQFGIDMLVPICLMTALGIFLDEKLGTSFLVVIFFFAGVAAGAQNVYRVAKRFLGPERDPAEKEHEKKNEGK